MKKTSNEVLQLQVNGFYRDVDLPDPEPDYSDIQEKYDELDGEEAVIEDDDRHTILEMHVDMNMPEGFDDPDGIARPYVVTIDKSSSTILAMRKNWYEDDEKKKSETTSSITDICQDLASMEQDLSTSWGVLRSRLPRFSVSSLTLVRYRIYLLVLRLAASALKAMTSAYAWRVQGRGCSRWRNTGFDYIHPLQKSLRRYSTLYSETLSKRDAE